MPGNQKVVELPAPALPKKKVVEPSQAAIDALPYGSGEWKVRGVLGLVVRCGAREKTYRLVRRVAGRLVKVVLGEMSFAEARRQAALKWKELKPRPSSIAEVPTLRKALEAYLEEKALSPRTKKVYQYAVNFCAPDLLDKRLDVIALDRAGMRARVNRVIKAHGVALAAQLVQVIRAVHNWHRKIYPDLPEPPTVACAVPRLKPRDWALSDDDLRAWWERVQRLAPIKRVWWLTAALTGARAGSICALKWRDVDLEKKVIRFSTAKGGRTYAIPMSDRLAAILSEYRENDWLPNDAGWVFPSPLNPERPLHTQVRNGGLPPAHAMRHTMRTRLAEAGATPDLARIALGHSLTQDVSQRYITTSLLIEAVRPLMNAVAERYAAIMGWDSEAQR